VTYDDELEQDYIRPIRSSHAPAARSSPLSKAKIRVLQEMIEKRPKLANNPQRLYDELRSRRHDISRDDIRHFLALGRGWRR
jgi:hypothetical protein